MSLVIPRAEWAGQSCPSTAPVIPGRRIDEFFLHQTVQVNRAWTRAQEREAMRALWRQHVVVNGWSDIGYTYVQFPSSRIYKARHVDSIPAAQMDHNAGTVALAVVGTNPILSVFQRRKIRKLFLELDAREGIPFLGGHRDVVATECPGDRIYGWVVKWRNEFNKARPVR
jgi:hypothetical protein